MELLLVGGGHAMLPALRRARQYTGASVTLLNDCRYLYYSGMMPEYLGGVYPQRDVRIDLRRLCRQSGVRFVKATATTVQPERRRVRTAQGRSWPYDLAAFDVGARVPGRPGGDALPTKPLYRLEDLERAVRDVLASPGEQLRLVIAGGGAAGVEIALNLTARFEAEGRAGALHLSLIDPAPRLLPSFPAGMGRWVARALRRRGVRLGLGLRAVDVSGPRVALSDGAQRPADAVLWATGTAAPALFAEAGLPTDDAGFVQVRRTLQVRAHPRLFAAGDGARVEGHATLARVGVHAVKQGPVLAENLARTWRALAARSPTAPPSLEPFRPYPVAPLLLSTGTPAALWSAGSLWFKGQSVLRLKHFIDRRWMRPYHGGRWQRAGLRAWLRAEAPLRDTP